MIQNVDNGDKFAHLLNQKRKPSKTEEIAITTLIKTENPSKGCFKKFCIWLRNCWIINKIAYLLASIFKRSNIKIVLENDLDFYEAKFSQIDYTLKELKTIISDLSSNSKKVKLWHLTFFISIIEPLNEDEIKKNLQLLMRHANIKEKVHCEILLKNFEGLGSLKKEIIESFKTLASRNTDSLKKAMDNFHKELKLKPPSLNSNNLKLYIYYFNFFKNFNLVSKDQLKIWEKISLIDQSMEKPKLPSVPKQKNINALPPGISNVGNTCYLDSGLQGMMACESIREAIDKRYTNKDLILKTINTFEEWVNSKRDKSFLELNTFPLDSYILDEIRDLLKIQEHETNQSNIEKAYRNYIHERRLLINILKDLNEINSCWGSASPAKIGTMVGKLRVTIFKANFTSELIENELYGTQDAAITLGIMLRAIDCDIPSIAIRKVISPTENPKNPYIFQTKKDSNPFMSLSHVNMTSSQAINYTAIIGNRNGDKVRKDGYKVHCQDKAIVEAETLQTTYKFKIKNNTIPAVLVIEWRNLFEQQHELTENDLSEFVIPKEAFYPALEEDVTYRLKSFAERHPGHWTAMVRKNEKWYRCDDLRVHPIEDQPIGKNCGIAFFELQQRNI